MTVPLREKDVDKEVEYEIFRVKPRELDDLFEESDEARQLYMLTNRK